MNLKENKNKIIIILASIGLLYFVNLYGLSYNNIQDERIDIGEVPNNITPSHHILYPNVDINNDNKLDTVNIVSSFYSKWLETDSTVKLIDVRNISGIGLDRLNDVDEYWIDLELIEKSANQISIIVVESEGLQAKGEIYGWKVIGFDKGKFFQRTPTIIEFLIYKLESSIPELDVY